MTETKTLRDEMKVWVVYRGGGYEGYSHPIGVYDTKEMADTWLKGAIDCYGTQPQVKELVLERQKKTDMGEE